MARRKDYSSTTWILIGVLGSAIIFIAYYYVAIEARYQVTEDFVDNPIMSPTDPRTYETEFCATKLTNLAHEFHFLEREIQNAEKVFTGGDTDVGDEQTVMQIEQREKADVKKEFDTYKDLCDQFDEMPTPALCEQFLTDARNQLEIAQDSARTAEQTGILERLTISSQNLRKAARIYAGMQAACEGTE